MSQINQNICKCELTQCKTCSKDSSSQNLCTLCDNEEGYYAIYDDLYSSNLSFYNCSKSYEGYYLEYDTQIYKPCYLSCKLCNISGNEKNHNCLECKYDYDIVIHYDNYKNCYNICSYHYINEYENKSYCLNNNKYPDNYNKLIEDKRECISNCYKDNKYNKVQFSINKLFIFYFFSFS